MEILFAEPMICLHAGCECMHFFATTWTLTGYLIMPTKASRLEESTHSRLDYRLWPRSKLQCWRNHHPQDSMITFGPGQSASDILCTDKASLAAVDVPISPPSSMQWDKLGKFSRYSVIFAKNRFNEPTMGSACVPRTNTTSSRWTSPHGACK